MQSPGSKNNSKKRAEKGPAQRLRQRTAILILLILVLGFGAAVLRLTYLTTVQSSELQESEEFKTTKFFCKTDFDLFLQGIAN